MAQAPTTADRLAAYLQAEQDCLLALRTSRGDRTREMAALADIQAGIKSLQAQLAAEQKAAKGHYGMATMLAGFNPMLTGE